MKNDSLKMAFKCLITLSLIFIGTLSAEPQSHNDPLHSNINKQLQEQNLSGIVWTTFRLGEVKVGASGISNHTTKAIMTTKNKVQVGSIAKTVLAIGVLRIITNGELALNDNVELLLPNLPWENPWHIERPVQIADLLMHTAGIDNLKIKHLFNSTDSSKKSLLENLAISDNDLTIKTRPGDHYSYSNIGYMLLAMVIEKKTNIRFEDYMAVVLKQLKMYDSTFNFVSQDTDQQLAMGYFEEQVAQKSPSLLLRAAGQFTTTASDMGQLLSFIINQGKLNEHYYISRYLMTLLAEPKTTLSYQAGLNMGHGLALAKRDRHGVIGHCHPGTTFGFRANLCIFPNDKSAFFYAVNTDSETANYESINKMFIEALMLPQKEISKTSYTISEHKQQTYGGLYTLSPSNMSQFQWLDYLFNSIWITFSATSVTTRALLEETKYLNFMSENLLRQNDRTAASHIFYLEDDIPTFSSGLLTYKKSSLLLFISAWTALILSILSTTFLCLKGIFYAISFRFSKLQEATTPFLALLLFFISFILYLIQPFMVLGEATMQSVLLSFSSLALPLSCLIASVKIIRKGKFQSITFASIGFLFVFTSYLLITGIFPLTFWR